MQQKNVLGKVQKSLGMKMMGTDKGNDDNRNKNKEWTKEH